MVKRIAESIQMFSILLSRPLYPGQMTIILTKPTKAKDVLNLHTLLGFKYSYTVQANKTMHLISFLMIKDDKR